MPILRSQRTYPLALKDVSQAPINAGITAAYDYQGDPNNSYSKGNGAAHVGSFNYTVPTPSPTLVEASPGIFGRDPSVAKTVNTTYTGGDFLKFGIGSADGKGSFTIHRRYRLPSLNPRSGNREWFVANYNDASGAKLALSLHERIEGHYFFRWSSGAANLPSTAAAAGDSAYHRQEGAIVDIHFVRDGDNLYYYLDGALRISGPLTTFTTLNTVAASQQFIRNGIGTTPIQDLVLIDETYWNRALSSSEVSQHRADPYAGYLNNVVAPTGTITSQPAPNGQSQRFVGTTTNATSGTYTLTGSDGGVTVGPAAFTVASNAFDFTVDSLVAGTYSPTLTVTGQGGTTGVTGTSSFSISGVGGGGDIEGGEPPISTVTSVTVTPSTATGSTTFAATVNGTNGPSQAVTWSASAGSINSAGVFAAPPATGSVQTITVTATSVQDNTKAGTATVTIAAVIQPPTVTSVVVTPATAQVEGGAQLQLSAQVVGTNSPSQAVTWSTSAGSISSSGLLTAPLATIGAQTVTVTATSVLDSSKSGTSTITVPAAAPVVVSVSISPSSAIVDGGAQQQFEATVNGLFNPSQSVVWATNLGSISQAGLLTAPESLPIDQDVIVTATSVQDNTKSGVAVVTVPAVLETTPPTLTGNLTAIATWTTITFSWLLTQATDDSGFFTYQYRIDGGEYQTASLIEQVARAKKVRNLKSGAEHQIDVRVVDPSGNASEPLTIQVSTLAWTMNSPAAKSRTIKVGGQSTTITSG